MKIHQCMYAEVEMFYLNTIEQLFLFIEQLDQLEVCVEMFYLNSTLNFGIPPVLVFQLEVYYEVDRLLTGLTAQPKVTTARWYSNKTSLYPFS